MTIVAPIKIYGLIDFERHLKTLEAEAPKQLRASLKKVGSIVYDDALPKIPVRTGAAKKSMKLRADQRRVSIKGGGDLVPYWSWLDFGGWVGRGRVSTPGGRRKAGTGSVYRKWLGRPVGNGRYFWKSFADKQDEIQRALDDVMAQFLRRAQLDADFLSRRAFLQQDAQQRRRDIGGRG